MALTGTRDVAPHRASVRDALRDEGRLELIVRRPAVDERNVVSEARLDTVLGLEGASWLARGSRSTPDGSADRPAR